MKKKPKQPDAAETPVIDHGVSPWQLRFMEWVARFLPEYAGNDELPDIVPKKRSQAFIRWLVSRAAAQEAQVSAPTNEERAMTSVHALLASATTVCPHSRYGRAECLECLKISIAAALAEAEERGAAKMGLRCIGILLENGWIGFFRSLRTIRALSPSAVCSARRASS